MRSRYSGFVLFDVVLAFSVLSSGLFALLSWWVVNTPDFYPERARLAAHNIAQTIRANNGNNPAPSNWYLADSPIAPVNCAATCSAPQFAQQQIAQWQQQLNVNLPQGQGRISTHPTQANSLMIEVLWQASQGPGCGGTNFGANAESHPTLHCYRQVIALS